MINNQKIILHYDALIDENNDPFFDPEPLKKYMDGWDGKAFFDLLKLKGKETVLEIGVGTGRIAAKVAKKCKEFYGIDISPKTAQRARENLSFLSNVNIITDDFCSHLFEQKFDVIYSSLTFMHIKNKEPAIIRATDLLCGGGRIVLSLDKSREKYIDYGTRKLEVFPDSPSDIKKHLNKAGIFITDECETERAYIIAGERQI